MTELEKIGESFEDEINTISYRLHYTKSKNEILDWLMNFDEKDYLIALDVLEKITYVEQRDLFLQCDKLFRKIIDEIDPQSKVYLIPLSFYGKSSSLLSYYYFKSPNFRKKFQKQKAKFLSNQFEIQNTSFDENSVIVFFDDFFGTGGTFSEGFLYFKEKANESQHITNQVYAICIYYMPEAVANIQKEFPNVKILGNRHDKIFGEDPLFFSSLTQNSQYKYTIEGYADRKLLYIDKGEKHNLGFKDSQALITFQYVPPNNTLPIIWSNKSNWKPLFPRKAKPILEDIKNWKKKYMHLAAKRILNIPEEHELMRPKKLASAIVYALLEALNQNKTLPAIIINFGVPMDEFNDYLEIAQNMGFINHEYKLTEEGLVELAEIKKKIKLLQIAQTSLPLNEKPIYIPKTFS